MRIAYLPLIAPILISGGCAGMIAGCGKDLTPLKTKEEVHAQLGEPSASGVAGGNFFEEFRTRWKISETAGSGWPTGYVQALAMTCGTVELLIFPYELYRVGRGTLLGQTIRVTYDAAGTVIGLDLDGTSLDILGVAPHHQGPEPSPTGDEAAALPPPGPPPRSRSDSGDGG